MKLVTSVPSKPALIERRAASACSRMHRRMSSLVISRGGRKCGSVCGTTEGWTQ